MPNAHVPRVNRLTLFPDVKRTLRHFLHCYARSRKEQLSDDQTIHYRFPQQHVPYITTVSSRLRSKPGNRDRPGTGATKNGEPSNSHKERGPSWHRCPHITVLQWLIGPFPTRYQLPR